ncbi:MAG: peptidylprolyl isomerase [Planctomycetota bacterium]
MVPAKPAVPSPLDALMGPTFWNRNRHRIFAGMALVAVVLAIFLFVQDTSRSREAAGWDEVEDLSALGQLRPHIDLTGSVKGTSAEPWALYNNAYSAFLDRNLDEAAQLMARLQAEFPDHELNRGSDVADLKADIDAEKAWTATNSLPEKNPQPSVNNVVTIATALGEVQIGLYPEQAPAATLAFLDLVRNRGLASGSFSEARPNSFIILSLPAPTGPELPSDESAEDDTEETPDLDPLVYGKVPDRNYLSHFKGAVTFRLRHPSTVDEKSQPQIYICLADTPNMDYQQVVFGSVLKGLESLQQAATRPLKSDNTGLLEPLAITGITEAPGLAELK